MADEPSCQLCTRSDRLEVLGHRRELGPDVVVETQEGRKVFPGPEEAVIDYRCGCGWSGTVGVCEGYRPPAGTPARA